MLRQFYDIEMVKRAAIARRDARYDAYSAYVTPLMLRQPYFHFAAADADAACCLRQR